MKIVCEECKVRAAEIVCCAGEDAAFCVCSDCDFKFHATPSNLPLVPTHKRFLLSSSTNLPMCDACQEMAGFFFCLEERQMLCRKCDVSRHVTAPKSAHQRIFIPGFEVGAHPIVDFDHNNKKKKVIDLPESSAPTQPMSANEFLEFEGNDASGLHDWEDSNEDIVEGGGNNNNSVRVAPPHLP